MLPFMRLAGIAGAVLLTLVAVLAALTLRADHTPEPSGPPATPPAAEAATPAPGSATTPDPVGAPIRVEVPAIGVAESLTGLGLQTDGAMELPDYGAAGWYDPGPPPGARGAAVVVAHVRGPDGPDVFAELAALTPGDRVTVRGTEGTATFVVDDVETVAKQDLPEDRIWPGTDRPSLRLITCGGEPLPGGGFPANTIAYAHLE